MITSLSLNELYGSLVNPGSDPFIVETEEQAENLKERIERATVKREITSTDEFEAAMQQLDLNGHRVKRIFSFVDGSEFLVCFSGDWS